MVSAIGSSGSSAKALKKWLNSGIDKDRIPKRVKIGYSYLPAELFVTEKTATHAVFGINSSNGEVRVGVNSAHGGHLEVIELLAAKADINVVSTRDGHTATLRTRQPR